MPVECPTASRATLLAEVRARLEGDSFPRLTVSVILTLAGGVAFLASAGALWAGLDSMGLRYGLAALAGYTAFILLVRAWIALRRGWTLDIDLPDIVPDLTTDGPRSDPSPVVGGGHTAGADWDISLDLDELVWVVLAVLLALGGVAAMAYVVYSAPVLLAEVALDAALVSAVYRRLRRDEAGHWATAVLRRTWLPALTLVVFVSLAGFALQVAAPDASSIGGVVRSLSN